MRPSKNKHPLAVIRTLHNMGQKEVASICGKSTRTIQSIELGKFNITEQVALKLSNYFNVDLAWLMNADPNAPILNKQGKPYDKLKDFDSKQAQEIPIERLGEKCAEFGTLLYYALLISKDSDVNKSILLHVLNENTKELYERLRKLGIRKNSLHLPRSKRNDLENWLWENVFPCIKYPK